MPLNYLECESSGEVEKKPGRPRAIPQKMVPDVLSLYRQGFGYRAIARQFRERGITVDWSTIRRIVKAHPGLMAQGEGQCP